MKKCQNSLPINDINYNQVQYIVTLKYLQTPVSCMNPLLIRLQMLKYFMHLIRRTTSVKIASHTYKYAYKFKIERKYYQIFFLLFIHLLSLYPLFLFYIFIGSFLLFHQELFFFQNQKPFSLFNLGYHIHPQPNMVVLKLIS